MPDPRTYEQAVSMLTFGIGCIERNPPKTAEEIHRISLLVMRLETLVSKQTRRLENVG